MFNNSESIENFCHAYIENKTEELIEKYKLFHRSSISHMIEQYLHRVKRNDGENSDFFEKKEVISSLIDHAIDLLDSFLIQKFGGKLFSDEELNLNEQITHGANKFLDQLSENFFVAMLRITLDYEKFIKPIFLDENKTFEISSIHWVGNDRHKQGQEALIIDFIDQDGAIKKIVYKTTPLQMSAFLFGDFEKLKELYPEKYPDCSLFSFFRDSALSNPDNFFEKNIREKIQNSRASTYIILPRVDDFFDEKEPSDEGSTTDKKYEKTTIHIKNYYGYTEFLSSMNDSYKNFSLYTLKKIMNKIPFLEIQHIVVAKKDDVENSSKNYFDTKGSKDFLLIDVLEEKEIYFFCMRSGDDKTFQIKKLDKTSTADAGALIKLESKNLGSKQRFCLMKNISSCLSNATKRYDLVNDIFSNEEILDNGNDDFITDSVDDLKVFWCESGILLSFLYLMGINDGHSENFIVHMKKIFLIDSETSFSFKVDSLKQMSCMAELTGGMLPGAFYVQESLITGCYNLLAANTLFYSGPDDTDSVKSLCAEHFFHGINLGVNFFKSSDSNFVLNLSLWLDNFSKNERHLYVRYVPVQTQIYKQMISFILSVETKNVRNALDGILNDYNFSEIFDYFCCSCSAFLKNYNNVSQDKFAAIWNQKQHMLFNTEKTLIALEGTDELECGNIPSYYVDINCCELIDFQSNIFRLERSQLVQLIDGEMANLVNKENSSFREFLVYIKENLLTLTDNNYFFDTPRGHLQKKMEALRSDHELLNTFFSDCHKEITGTFFKQTKFTKTEIADIHSLQNEYEQQSSEEDYTFSCKVC